MICKFVLILFFSFNKNYLEVKSLETGKIVLDGVIEEIWKEADSIIIEKQFSPYYDSLSTYRTTVKVLQDKYHLFFLIKTNFGKDKPRTSLSGYNESYDIFLDPSLSKVNAYLFGVSSSGGRADGMILEDGKRFDFSWDGVWESKVRIYEDKGEWFLIVEVRIPFKIMRVDKNKNVWGVQFKSYYQKPKETCYWILPDREEGLRISEFGELRNVKPEIYGINMEFYPVGLIKNTYYSVVDERETGKTAPWAGIDIAYKKEKHYFNFTLFPDFAEIESDPFTISLGKYEIYYSERRPFFLEGKEIFEPSGIPAYYPVKVFYSRRIGRRLKDGSGEVPIITGLKYTGKFERYETGILSALTDRKFGIWDSAWTTSWNALRIKRYFLKNSETGVLSTYKYNTEKDEWAFAIDSDGIIRWEKNSFGWQAVFNRKDEFKKWGYLFKSGTNIYLNEKINTHFSGTLAGDRFDISDMGYAALYPGDRDFSGGLTYQNYPDRGMVENYSISNNLWISKEKIDKEWSKGLSLWGSLRLRKPLLLFMGLGGGYGEIYEGDIHYYLKGGHGNIWVEIGKMNFAIGSNFHYGWNYRRDFLAWQGDNFAFIHFPIGDRISFNLSSNTWIEFDSTGSYLASTLVLRPRISYSFTPFMSLNFLSEPVFINENNEWNISQMRVACYYYWEIKPRSRFYIVLNQLFYKQREKWITGERIYALKLRWLFLF